MSEASSDQPAAEAPVAEAPAGVAAEPTQASDDISTEAFDRVEAPDDDDATATGDGQADEEAGQEKPDLTTAQLADTVEVEDETGAKHTIPKALEKGFMLERDYRLKTSALADARRNFETEQTRQLESLKEFRTEHLAIDTTEAQLAGIEKDLGAYRKLTPQDWASLKAENPAAYDQHMSNFEILRTSKLSTQERLDAAKADLKTKETSLTERLSAADEAKLNDNWKQANVVLAEKIPGWGPDKFQEIGAWVREQFPTVTVENLKNAADPVSWTMANRLMKAEAEVTTLKAQLKQKTAATTTAKTLEAPPAAKPAGGNAAPRGVTDGLSDVEWFRRRAAQKARKAG